MASPRISSRAVRNSEAMSHILQLMRKLGYIERIPTEFLDLSFLDRASQELAA